MTLLEDAARLICELRATERVAGDDRRSRKITRERDDVAEDRREDTAAVRDDDDCISASERHCFMLSSTYPWSPVECVASAMPHRKLATQATAIRGSICSDWQSRERVCLSLFTSLYYTILC